MIRGDEGQALVFSVLLLGLAAMSIVGLRLAQDRILDGVRDERAGEAAVAAAGAAVADLQVTRARELGRDLDRAETASFVTGPSVIEAARDAAARLARLHGRADPSGVTVHAFGLEIEVHLTLAGRRHIALLEPAP